MDVIIAPYITEKKYSQVNVKHLSFIYSTIYINLNMLNDDKKYFYMIYTCEVIGYTETCIYL